MASLEPFGLLSQQPQGLLNQGNWERGMLLPIDRNTDYWPLDPRGYRLAMPMILEEAIQGITAPGRALQGGYQPTWNEQAGRVDPYSTMIPDALNLASSITLGSGAMPSPKGVLRMGADYRGQHRAPVASEDTAPLFRMTDIYPDDIYSNQAWRYYGHGGGSEAIDRETARIVASFKDKPDANVTIYRAVPNDIEADIQPGDWVTVNRNYAASHGEIALDGNYRIIEKVVPANSIWTDGNSIHEFGYSPTNP